GRAPRRRPRAGQGIARRRARGGGRAAPRRARRGRGGELMLYYLLFPLRHRLPALNVFRYITFRAAMAIVTALLLSWFLGPSFIRALRRLSVGQNIREVGPQAHQVKAGTPTMGGLLILFAVLVPTLLWTTLDDPYVWVVVFVTVGYGAIGFLDDFLKVKRHKNLG